MRLTLELARELIGAPRHLSQHPGGFVLTQDRLDDLVPIEPAAMENRQVIEWDKNDIEILKFMKVDVLGLGMLGCMRRSFELLREHKEHRATTWRRSRRDDPATYDMIRRADTVGVFQIESRAQMAMLPRMKPRNFYDLVIEVAIVRPGPIQGDMVHPYIRRREGREEVSYPTPELERVLGKTLGVPLFQEQAMRVAIECAGFTPSEADQLRRSMATFKFKGDVSKFQTKLHQGMLERGYSAGIRRAHLQAARRLRLLWLSGEPRRLLRAHRLCVVLDEMPSSGCVLLRPPQRAAHGLLRAGADRSRCAAARRRGAARRRQSFALGLHAGTNPSARIASPFASGFGWPRACQADGAAIVQARDGKPFASIEDIWLRAKLHVAALERLAEADAFGSFGLNRRDALWKIKGLGDDPLAALRGSGRARWAIPPGSGRAGRFSDADDGRT